MRAGHGIRCSLSGIGRFDDKLVSTWTSDSWKVDSVIHPRRDRYRHLVDQTLWAKEEHVDENDTVVLYNLSIEVIFVNKVLDTMQIYFVPSKRH
jgi:hypothetical protein